MDSIENEGTGTAVSILMRNSLIERVIYRPLFYLSRQIYSSINPLSLSLSLSLEMKWERFDSLPRCVFIQGPLLLIPFRILLMNRSIHYISFSLKIRPLDPQVALITSYLLIVRMVSSHLSFIYLFLFTPPPQKKKIKKRSSLIGWLC